jgi:DnaD/phage-associated family protein
MRKKLIGAGFQSPNFTQTPNDFFELIDEMSDAELRVTLVMIRATFGFHRATFKMGLKKLAAAAGLSLNGTRAGVDAAEQRGTFKRSNPDAQGEAQWELIVEDATTEWGAASERVGVQPVNAPRAATAPQSPVKESIKERIKQERDMAATQLAELQGGGLNSMDAQRISEWKANHTDEWITKAIQTAKDAGARSSAYVDRVLIGWEANGYPKTREQLVSERRASRPAPKESMADMIDRVLGATNG